MNFTRTRSKKLMWKSTLGIVMCEIRDFRYHIVVNIFHGMKLKTPNPIVKVPTPTPVPAKKSPR